MWRAKYGAGMLFPPPEKHNDPILAVVVEKKGDETRTSMRQSEIYAFSYDIIIRDGYMVMPKICWKDFNPGDWFVCERTFSKDRHGNQKEERELQKLEKIDTEHQKRLEIPATRVFNGAVQIAQWFMLCPTFIRNHEVQNSFGRYKKLYVMYIGQGFVHNSREKLFRVLKPGRVYKGVFEFHAKDNGAVNFGHRHEMKDHTGHVLERDAMWELVKVTEKEGVPLAKHEVMSEVIAKLESDAQKFHDELQAKISKSSKCEIEEQLVKESANSRRRSLRATSRRNRASGNGLGAPCTDLVREPLLQTLDGNEADTTIVAPPNIDETILEHAQLGNSGYGTRRLSEPFDIVAAQSSPEVFGNTPTVVPVVIETVEQLNTHRTRTIMQTRFEENGEHVIKWIDRESGETSTNFDILNFKFNARYNYVEEPQSSSEVSLAISPSPFRRENVNDMSTFSDIMMDERVPLAASTPRTSPVMARRFFGDRNNSIISRPQSRVPLERSVAYIEHDVRYRTIDREATMITNSFEVQDNNANPSVASG